MWALARKNLMIFQYKIFFNRQGGGFPGGGGGIFRGGGGGISFYTGIGTVLHWRPPDVHIFGSDPSLVNMV